MMFVVRPDSPQTTQGESDSPPAIWRYLGGCLGVALLAHGILWLDLPLVWPAAAALVLAGLLPGYLLVDLLVGGDSTTAPTPGERLLYAVGSGYAWIVVGMLLLNYLPGPLHQTHVLLFYDGALVLLGALLWRRSRVHRRLPTVELTSSPRSAQVAFVQPAPDYTTSSHWISSHWMWIGLLTVALVGGLLRFPNLDYSEFQGDEARAILRAAETLRGDRDAIYAHQKGPAEILAPALIYALRERLNEAAARLPFALAGFAGLFAVLLLGARMFHPVAGFAAALLLALDGYFIGFARIVQYQSLVFLMTVLCLLIFYRLARSPHLSPAVSARYLALAALLLATGLLAHYEAALVVVPGFYLLLASRYWVTPDVASTDQALGRSPLLPRRVLPQPARLARTLAVPIAVGATVLALFYVPFVFHPTFGSTYGYIAESRIGGDFPYNNLADFFRRTTLYSTTYYIGLLALCVLLGLSAVYRRALPQRWRGVAVGLLWLGTASAVWLAGYAPAWLGTNQDPTWLFFLVAFGVAWFAPKLSPAERAVWLWLGALMILMLFFVRTPNTHVYGFIIPWAVVAGMVLARGWERLSIRLDPTRATFVAVGATVAASLLFGIYVYSYFTASTREVLHTWRENRPPGYWVPYDMPDRARFSSFGFPMRNGWKAIGALYSAPQAGCHPIGSIQPGNSEQNDCLALYAPFTTNDRQAVADWYTRGAAFCPRDHRYYILTYPVEPGELENIAQLRDELLVRGYVGAGVVEVHGRDKIEIYDRYPALPATGNGPQAPPRLDVADHIAHFDRELSGPWFEPNGPTTAPALQQRLDYRFGDHIWLEGYRLERTGRATSTNAAGTAVVLTLYWRTDQPLDTAYTVFNQILRLEDFHKIGQQDGEPGCDAFPTDGWRAGVTIADRYYIPLDVDAEPGVYTVLMGLYDRTTGDRLPIFAPNGAFIGDALGVDEVEVLP